MGHIAVACLVHSLEHPDDSMASGVEYKVQILLDSAHKQADLSAMADHGLYDVVLQLAVQNRELAYEPVLEHEVVADRRQRLDGNDLQHSSVLEGHCGDNAESRR
jgi:hypothetical protein